MKIGAKKRNITVVLWLAGSAGRKQLTGILRYVNEGYPWSVHLITEPKDFTDKIVRKALDYINDHATNGITVGDVVRHLRVSRRLADRRFSGRRRDRRSTAPSRTVG